MSSRLKCVCARIAPKSPVCVAMTNLREKEGSAGQSLTASDPASVEGIGGQSLTADTRGRKRKARDDDDSGGTKEGKGQKAKECSCGCPCAEPEKMVRLENDEPIEREGEEFPFQCVCTRCGPIGGGGSRRCTVGMSTVAAFHSLLLHNRLVCHNCC